MEHQKELALFGLVVIAVLAALAAFYFFDMDIAVIKGKMALTQSSSSSS
jgi:hypothetical protein